MDKLETLIVRIFLILSLLMTLGYALWTEFHHLFR
jgi:hypothetical protein